MALFQITLPYACAGIETETLNPYAVVVRAAPIFQWMLGKPFYMIEQWVVRKYGTIRMVMDETSNHIHN